MPWALTCLRWSGAASSSHWFSDEVSMGSPGPRHSALHLIEPRLRRVSTCGPARPFVSNTLCL